MFEEVINFAKGSHEENNHIQKMHVFVSEANKEVVSHVLLINSSGTMNVCLAEKYKEVTGLNLIEGRIRSLGVRIFFENEEGFNWYKDIYFHKGVTYTSNHR